MRTNIGIVGYYFENDGFIKFSSDSHNDYCPFPCEQRVGEVLSLEALQPLFYCICLAAV